MSSEPLYQMAVLTDFIRLMVWTGQLPDERPCSAIIVADAGAGKTSLLQQAECDQAKFLGDLTSRPLHGLLKNDKLTHLLLGDMLSIFGHKKSTVDLTLQSIAKMTGEVIKQDPWTGEEIPPRMIGVLTAIPPGDLNSRAIKKHIDSGGFASRFMMVRYSYRPSTIAAIHRFIADNKYADIAHTKNFALTEPGKYLVKIPPEFSNKIKDLSARLQRDELGFRAHRYLRGLVKAQARRNKRNVVTVADYKLVETYCDFFTSKGKEI